MRKRTTSIEAFKQIKESGLLSRRRAEVYEILFHHGPMTTREVFNLIRPMIKDVGAVSTRLTELRRCGVVEEIGTTLCSETGMSVINWDVTDKLPVKFEKPKRIECPHCEGKGYIESAQARLL